MDRTFIKGTMMKWFDTLLVLAGFGLLVVTPRSEARCYAVSYRYPTYYYSPPVVYKEYIKEYIPVAPVAYLNTIQLGYGTVVPAAVIPPTAPALASGAALAPGSAVAGQARTPVPNNDALQLVMTELRGLSKRLELLEKKMVSGSGTSASDERVDPFRGRSTGPPVVDKALAIYAAKCVACHAHDKAAKEGGGFVLLDKDGNRAPLNGSQTQKFTRHVVRGTMPLKDNKYGIQPLTDPERTELLDDLGSFPQKEPPAGGSGVRLIRAVIRPGDDHLVLPRR